MLVTPTIILGLLAVVSACPDWHEDRADGRRHSTRAAPPQAQTITLPTRPLQWGDVNIIHTTDSHGWLLGHQKTSFPEPNYRCIEAPSWNNRKVDIIQWWFRWFRVVRGTYENNCYCTCFSLRPCELASKSLFRSAMLIFCSSILEICTMVCMSTCCKPKYSIPVTYWQELVSPTAFLPVESMLMMYA